MELVKVSFGKAAHDPLDNIHFSTPWLGCRGRPRSPPAHQKHAAQDAKQMRSSICQLAERVAEAELQLKPPQAGYALQFWAVPDLLVITDGRRRPLAIERGSCTHAGIVSLVALVAARHASCYDQELGR